MSNCDHGKTWHLTTQNAMFSSRGFEMGPNVADPYVVEAKVVGKRRHCSSLCDI